MTLNVLLAAYLTLTGLRSPDRSVYDMWNAAVDASMRARHWAQAGQQAHQAAQITSGAYGQVAYFQTLSCQARISHHHYNEALRDGLLAREAALLGRKWRILARAEYCLMRVYRHLDNLELAYQAGHQMLAALDREPGTRTLEYRVFFASLLLKLGRSQEAFEQARLVIREADLAPVAVGSAKRIDHTPPTATADALELIGRILIHSGQLSQAEFHLTEAFRIRRMLFPHRLVWSYSSLAELRMAQNRPLEAARFWSQALLDPTSGLQPWFLYYYRANANLALGRESQALDDLLAALSTVKDLRLHLPFGDDIQIESEVSLHSIFSLAVETAARLGKAGLAISIASESRASSIRSRAAASGDWRLRLHPRYPAVLAELRRLQSAGDPSARFLQRELVEMESSAGLAESPGLQQPFPWKSIAALMHPGDRFTFFYTLSSRSLRWTIENNSLRMDWIAGENAINAAAAEFRNAVRLNHPSHRELGRSFYSLIFGSDAPPPAGAVWTVLPDDELFQVPFSAITHPATGRYLAQHAAIRLASSATPRPRRDPRSAPLFAAFADPVGNRADERWNTGADWWRRFRQPLSQDSIPLPRLAGSRTEVQLCARVWTKGESLILTGRELLRPGMLPHRAAVFHFATHVVQPSLSTVPAPVIFLGLSDSGEQVNLTESEIEALPAAPDLVTLSGCGSGAGRLAPGAGLLGLTRAWLMAGANGVLASLWAVPDGSGQIFAEYYKTLQQLQSNNSRSAAIALASAQVAAAEKSRVSVWASYFVIGVLEAPTP